LKHTNQKHVSIGFFWAEETIVKLTRYTDYSLRVLLYLGAKGDRLSSIADIARAYAISQNLFGVSTFETVWGFRLEEGFGLIAVT
jgi:hypothetical protein